MKIQTTATPVYSLQTRTEQRKTIERTRGRGFVWILALEYNANALGVREKVAQPLEWPFVGYLPYIPADAQWANVLLILLRMEVSANLPSAQAAPYLLPCAELAAWAGRYRAYEWPELLVDKVCARCGAVWVGRYDEEIGCCSF